MWIVANLRRHQFSDLAVRLRADPTDFVRPAAKSLDLVTTKASFWLRLTSAVFCGGAAFVALGPPARLGAVIAAVAAVVVWSVVFCVLAGNGRLGAATVWGDALLALALAAAQPWLVAADHIEQGVGWTTPLITVSIVIVVLRLPPAAAIPAAAVLVAVHLSTAAYLAGWPAMAGLAINMGLQIVLTSLLVLLLRRVSANADRALRESARMSSEAAIADQTLQTERTFQRTIHDTALATLTMVGNGSVSHQHDAIREQSRRDLAMLHRWADDPGSFSDVRQDLQASLLEVVEGMAAVGFRATLTGPPVSAPEFVVQALVGSVREALVNVHRHAGVAEATVAVRRTGGTITVTVTDRGKGFDLDQLSPRNVGIRLSILGRMADIGGTAAISAAPGEGCQVSLGWQHG